MSAPVEIREGDIVLVRGRVINGAYPLIEVGGFDISPAAVEIVANERPHFRVGDRVRSGHIHGEVLGVFEGQLWVRPDSGNRVPSTFDAVACDREPAPPPSAEIIDGPGRLVPRAAEAAE